MKNHPFLSRVDETRHTLFSRRDSRGKTIEFERDQRTVKWFDYGAKRWPPFLRIRSSIELWSERGLTDMTERKRDWQHSFLTARGKRFDLCENSPFNFLSDKKTRPTTRESSRLANNWRLFMRWGIDNASDENRMEIGLIDSYFKLINMHFHFFFFIFIQNYSFDSLGKYGERFWLIIDW